MTTRPIWQDFTATAARWWTRWRGAPISMLPPPAPLSPPRPKPRAPLRVLTPATPTPFALPPTVARRTRGKPAPPRLLALRHRAVFDLFEAAQLGPPPMLVWRFIESDDVGTGVDRFLRAVGAERDGAALLDLLRAEPGLRAAGPDQASTWEADLLSGDPDRFGVALRASAAAGAPRLEDHWPADLAPTGQALPFGSPIAEDIAAALAEHTRLRDALLAWWPDAAPSASVGDQLAGAISRFQDAELLAFAALMTSIDPAPALSTMHSANQAMAATMGASASSDSINPTVIDTAAIEAAADWDGAVQLWQSLRWRHHPDRPGLAPADRLDRQRACAAADRALARHERLLGRAA